MKRISMSFAMLAILGVSSACASTVAYSDPAFQGTQGFGGNLALNFNVNSPITVNALGVFNAAGDGIIHGLIQVAIFDTVSNLQVTPTVSFQGVYAIGALGFDVFQAIAPVLLGPGSYQIDAVGFSGADPNGNLNTGSSSGPVLDNGGGAITFTGASYDGSAVLDHPNSCGSCQPPPTQFRQFDAGTFSFDTGSATVPEPGTLGLLGCGFLAVSALLRRRRA